MSELKALRTGKNLTMKQVSEMAGIAESTYSLIESGNRRPSPEVAQRLGECLGFDWTRFYVKHSEKKNDSQSA